MVKPKQKQLAAAVVKSNNSQNALENPSDVSVDLDLFEEDSWVHVKKQRVNILIPCLPTNQTDVIPQLLDEKPAEVPVFERNDHVSISSSPETNIQSAQEVCAPEKVVAMTKPIKLDLRKPNKISLQKIHRTCVRNSVIPLRQGNLPNYASIVNKMTRAKNFERKIVRAGGLSRWLSSLGLEQFARVFRGKKMNKFELANLSMKMLKDMGFHAVGPRRKLIHAIECLSQPYGFESL